MHSKMILHLEKLEVIEGNIIDDKAVQDRCGYECYDVVCANILADVLEPLSAEITQHMKPGAYFITSGIIDTKEQEVAECFKKNPELEIVEINHDGEWVNITARKKRYIMYHFFAQHENIHDTYIDITGDDVNHVKNVLRMKTGDELLISSGSNVDYYCHISEMTDDNIRAEIDSIDEEGRELGIKVWLFQGLPKGDKMELIIQKMTELGVYRIVPVSMKTQCCKA